MSSGALERANGVLDRTYVTRAACEAVANDVLALLAEVARLEQGRGEAVEDVARCAADTTAADLAQDVEFLKAEKALMQERLDNYSRQAWSLQNRAEVAERGHKAALARDFEQRAALAVAREREQRATDALRVLMRYARAVDIQAAEIQGGADFRAALVDEPAAASEAISRPNEMTATNVPEFEWREPPAAATLAEPGQAEAQGEAAASRSGQGSLDGNAQGSGSASAAADEPPKRYAKDGYIVGNSTLTYGDLRRAADARAAADEPGETLA